MSKVVKVYVVDSNGRGLSGQRVKEYGGSEMRTDSNGCVSLCLEGSNTTIYVNRFEAHNGSVSRLEPKIFFNKDGSKY